MSGPVGKASGERHGGTRASLAQGTTAATPLTSAVFGNTCTDGTFSGVLNGQRNVLFQPWADAYPICSNRFAP